MSPGAAQRPFRLAPGLALAGGVAIGATAAEPSLRALVGFSPPAMVVALVIGIAGSAFAAREVFDPGLTFAVKTLLRWAIGLLGLRIALGDIAALGWPIALLVVASMAGTILGAIWLAGRLKLEAGFGALAGAANAVCGASATLATATALPDYRTKARDIAFTVVMANAVSTLAMLAYPPLCTALGFDARLTGVMLGGTIQDMAQVVGAGYAVSEAAGNSAVIVKLFRVFLLLPVVLAIGWWFVGRAGGGPRAKVPVPVFALVFIALSLVNSFVPASFASLYEPARAALIQISNAGLLIAIAALGLSTSLGELFAIGWRHLVVFIVASLAILALVTIGLTLA